MKGVDVQPVLQELSSGGEQENVTDSECWAEITAA